jgi:hypothetical protein
MPELNSRGYPLVVLALVFAFGLACGLWLGFVGGVERGAFMDPAPCIDVQINTPFSGVACTHERHRLRYVERVGTVCLCEPAQVAPPATVADETACVPEETALRSAEEVSDGTK